MSFWPKLLANRKNRRNNKANLRRNPAFRPRIETLESRVMLSAVQWIGGGHDNLWTDPANWVVAGTSPAIHRVPTSADDVTINLSGSPTISLGGGSDTVHGLICVARSASATAT